MSNYAIPVTSAGAAIAQTSPAFDDNRRQLSAILVHVSAAPVTSEDLVVSIDAAAGSAFDAVLYRKDLLGVTDIAYTDIRCPLQIGDALRVTYANTDHRTIGVLLALE